MTQFGFNIPYPNTNAEIGQSDQTENNAGDEEDILQHLLSGENPLSWI